VQLSELSSGPVPGLPDAATQLLLVMVLLGLCGGNWL
jgi:hypothetical protein